MILRIAALSALLLSAASAWAGPAESYRSGTEALAGADLVAAAFHFLEAAEEGHVEAQRELGRLYLEGKGVDPSASEAVRWLRKAAEKGDAGAHLSLGRAYLGKGVVRASRIRARYWLTKAAGAGLGEAKVLLKEAEALRAASRPPRPAPVGPPAQAPSATEYLAGATLVHAAEEEARKKGRADPSTARQALAFLRRMQHDPSLRARLAYYLVSGALGEHDSAEAVELMQQPSNEYPPDLLNAVAYGLASQEVFLEEALGFVQQSLKESPEDGHRLDTLGWVLHKLGRNQEAAEVLARVQSVSAEEELRLHRRAVAFALRGESDGTYRVDSRDLEKVGDEYVGRKVVLTVKIRQGRHPGPPHELVFPVTGYSLALDTSRLAAPALETVSEVLGSQQPWAEVRGRLRRRADRGPRYAVEATGLREIQAPSGQAAATRPARDIPAPVRVDYPSLLLAPEKYAGREVILEATIMWVSPSRRSMRVTSGNAHFEVHFGQLPQTVQAEVMRLETGIQGPTVEITGTTRPAALGDGLDIDARRLVLRTGASAPKATGSPRPSAAPPVRVKYTDILLDKERYLGRMVIVGGDLRSVRPDTMSLRVRSGNATFVVFIEKLPKVLKRRLLEYEVSWDQSPIEVTGVARKPEYGSGVEIDAHRVVILPGNPEEPPTVPSSSVRPGRGR